MKITKFEIILNMWVCLLMSLNLSYAIPILGNGAVTTSEYLSGVVVSYIVGFAIITFLPLVRLGNMFADKCGLKPGSAPYMLVANIILTLTMGTIMSLVMTWWGVHSIPGYTSFIIQAWSSTYIATLLVIYVVSSIGLLTGVPLTKKILGIPSGPPPGNH